MTGLARGTVQWISSMLEVLPFPGSTRNRSLISPLAFAILGTLCLLSESLNKMDLFFEGKMFPFAVIDNASAHTLT